MQDFPLRTGMEFDGFALADAGRVAVFATACVGPVAARNRPRDTVIRSRDCLM